MFLQCVAFDFQSIPYMFHKRLQGSIFFKKKGLNATIVFKFTLFF